MLLFSPSHFANHFLFVKCVPKTKNSLAQRCVHAYVTLACKAELPPALAEDQFKAAARVKADPLRTIPPEGRRAWAAGGTVSGPPCVVALPGAPPTSGLQLASLRVNCQLLPHIDSLLLTLQTGGHLPWFKDSCNLFHLWGHGFKFLVINMFVIICLKVSLCVWWGRISSSVTKQWGPAALKTHHLEVATMCDCTHPRLGHGGPTAEVCWGNHRWCPPCWCEGSIKVGGSLTIHCDSSMQERCSPTCLPATRTSSPALSPQVRGVRLQRQYFSIPSFYFCWSPCHRIYIGTDWGSCSRPRLFSRKLNVFHLEFASRLYGKTVTFSIQAEKQNTCHVLRCHLPSFSDNLVSSMVSLIKFYIFGILKMHRAAKE